MKYCKKCIIPDTRPDQIFDSSGVCNACLSYERNQKINWKNRSEELKNLIDEAKKSRSRWKCVIPSSGGKDSTYQALRAKELGYSRIFLESGIKLISNFLSKNLIDEFKLFISDRNLGKNGDANFKKYYRLFLNEKKNIIEKVNLLGDRLLTYKLR